MPSLDVFVPNRDYGRWLDECVESVLSQPDVDVRVLVIDNASRDGSQDIALALASADSRVDVRLHERDQGLIASLQEGLAWCQADYCLNLSADDRVTAGALGRAVRLLERRPEVGLVYGPTLRQADGRRAPRGVGTRPVTKVWPGQHWLRQRARAGRNPLDSPEGVLRTSVAQSVGYRPELPTVPDFWMWMGVAARADVGHLRGVQQAVYRLHPNSMMHGLSGQPLTGLHARWSAFGLLAEGDGHLLVDPEGLLADAACTLAVQAVRAVELYADWGELQAIPTTELLTFAHELHPDIEATSAWRGMQRACARGRHSPVRLAHMVGHKAADTVADHVRRQLGH